jgi:hypothetical protein
MNLRLDPKRPSCAHPAIRRAVIACVWFAASAPLATPLHAQETAATLPVAIDTDTRPYTVKSGDFRLLLTPTFGVDWNDNINTSDDDALQDFILKPAINAQVTYPITKANLLRVNIGVGYDAYLDNTDYSGFRLSSGSEISFDAYIQDFRINLHDRFQYTQDAAGQSAIANSGRYGGFDNTVGLSGTWDLRDVVLTLGYDHNNYISSTSDYEYTDRASEIFSTRAGFRVHPEVTTGVEASVSLTAYDQHVLNDNQGYNAGVYADWQPSPALHIQPRVGYTYYAFDQTSKVTPAEDQDAWYVDLTLSHAITEAVSYSLSAGHELRLGIQADSVEVWYVRPNVTFKIVKDLNLSAFFSYENGDQGSGKSTGTVSETYDWINTGFALRHQITKRLSASLNYRLGLRSSDAASRGYTQNLVGLLFSYALQ